MALGASNFASGILQGLPLGAGFFAASANYAAGTRWYTLVRAGLVEVPQGGVLLFWSVDDAVQAISALTPAPLKNVIAVIF